MLALAGTLGGSLADDLIGPRQLDRGLPGVRSRGDADPAPQPQPVPAGVLS